MRQPSLGGHLGRKSVVDDTETRFLAFEEYERLFFWILGRLAREGYSVPSGEAMDCIHEFYVQVWITLDHGYDPKLAPAQNYVGGAFYKFAKRHALKWQSQRYRLVDIDQLAHGLVSESDPAESASIQQLTELLANAVSTLSESEEAVLVDFLFEHDNSERSLAIKHKCTRYEIRESLANSIGSVTAKLVKHGGICSKEAEIAYQIWEEGRSPKALEKLHGISRDQLEQLKRDYISSLKLAVRK